MGTRVAEMQSFADRDEAGRVLGALCRKQGLGSTIVLGLPRGGVPVAKAVAEALGAPLDVVPVRKVGCPGNPELGIGAVAEGGGIWLDHRAIELLDLTAVEVGGAVDHARRELAATIARLRPNHSPLPLNDATVVLVDDGIATGGTMEAAVGAARARGASRIVVAVPVGAPESLRRLRGDADDVIAVLEPVDLGAIGWFYDDFAPVPDERVLELLTERVLRVAEVRIPTRDGELLHGDLLLPAEPRSLIAFAHGSGSSRHSPRNRAVARRLGDAGLATLLFDLLTPAEGGSRALVFDIRFLADRLEDAIRWAAATPETRRLPLGLFGASTGAAAALMAAAAEPERVAAVVSRGGRPDLAGNALTSVRAPVLLLVGGADTEVLALNRAAQARLTCPSDLVVIPGATHLFEEPGALDAVADHAAAWFLDHLPAPSPQ